MSEYLLSCPFCGITPFSASAGEGGHIIVCLTEDCIIKDNSLFSMAEEDGLQMWNKRSQQKLYEMEFSLDGGETWHTAHKKPGRHTSGQPIPIFRKLHRD